MIRYQLQVQNLSDTKVPEIVLEVRNVSEFAIADLIVTWEYGVPNDTEQQPVLLESGVYSFPSRFKCAKTAEFWPVVERPLLPGHSRQYFFPSEWESELLSELNALSCEDYEIRIRGNGDLIQSISGREFGTWVETEYLRGRSP